MNNFFKIFVFSILFFLSSFSLAEETTNTTIADIKLQLISQMEKDGYLSGKMAGEVAQKYITEKDKNTFNKEISARGESIEQVKETAKEIDTVKWTDYLSLINFVKVAGVIFLLVAFWSFVQKAIISVWFIIATVPVIIYQLAFLGVSVFGLIRPELIWASQYFYVALFCSFSTVIVLGWIIVTYEQIGKAIAKIFNLGIHPSCVASFYGMIYFGVLAIIYQSSIFGFFAAVCLSGIFSFGLYYAPGILYLNFKENMMSAVVLGHIIVLGAYVYMFKNMPEYTMYFNAGIQYYCTIALCVGLLVATSPFYKPDSAIGYALIFIILFGLAIYGYHFYELKVVASIIMGFFILFVLEWIGYIGYQTGIIVGSGIVGGTLYGLALLLEKYGSMIVLTMNH